jgi:hypothetical protein
VSDELFDSEVRAKGDLAGVFEYDGETGYFYLYDVRESEGQRILDSIRVILGDTELVEQDVSVRWDERQERVGLFLRGVQWAVFNVSTGAKHGGNFGPHAHPNIPPAEKFGT